MFLFICFSKPPKALKPWKKTLDATETSPLCVQPTLSKPGESEIKGEEDCLYLAIYTPQVDYTNSMCYHINLLLR